MLSPSHTKKGPGRYHRHGTPGRKKHGILRTVTGPDRNTLERAKQRRLVYMHSVARSWTVFIAHRATQAEK